MSDPPTAELDNTNKRERFLRLAEKRTQRVMDALRVLGNCSNQAAYEYTENDLKKIFSAIDRELERTRDRFYGSKRRKFTLADDEGGEG